MSLEATRQASQLAFVQSGAELQVGRAEDCPLAPDVLARTAGDEPYVVATLSSGLTAWVHRLRLDGRDWALKLARPECLVKNVDGQTSFLNEIQRRAEFAALKRQPGWTERFKGVADTTYASLKQGLILSPWIAGGPVQAWDVRRLEQFFALGAELVLAGFFEWDFCSGNIIDGADHIQLFDFGYMYRFDPLRHFNSAGSGTSAPQFHLAERFETRNYFAVLLQVESTQGMNAALAAFRLEKAIALDAYRRLHSRLASQGATDEVCDWIEAIARDWDAALRSDLLPLYRREGWRSHTLDLEDDLHGRTCTPMTLRRADWLLGALKADFDALRAAGAFSAQDTVRSQQDLIALYADKRELAAGLQTPG